MCASFTQAVISLSVGEAEFYASVKVACRVIGLSALAADIGWSLKPRLWSDSSASIGTGSRRGAGSIRHIQTQTLWLQRTVSEKRLGLCKIKGTENLADIGTKVLDGKTLERLWTQAGLVYRYVSE